MKGFVLIADILIYYLIQLHEYGLCAIQDISLFADLKYARIFCELHGGAIREMYLRQCIFFVTLINQPTPEESFLQLFLFSLYCRPFFSVSVSQLLKFGGLSSFVVTFVRSELTIPPISLAVCSITCSLLIW